LQEEVQDNLGGPESKGEGGGERKTALYKERKAGGTRVKGRKDTLTISEKGVK